MVVEARQMLKAGAIFKNGMVLQQDAEVCIFGQCSGQAVTVLYEGQAYSAQIDGNRWMVRIPTGHSLQAKSLTITDNNESIVIEDILLGEVWLAGGQSNMELELQNSLDGESVIKDADFEQIRFYNVPKIANVGEELYKAEEDSSWKKAVGDNCRGVSAVAFYFACKLHSELKVPIGIIDCYWGGTSATCWVSPAALDGIKEIEDYLQEWDEVINSKSDRQYDQEYELFERDFQAWDKKVRELKDMNPQLDNQQINEMAGPCPWNPPRGRKSPYRPYGLHQSMVERIAPYTIKGAIYYQGEEDGGRAFFYGKLNKAVINQWREDFENSNLPFYITQLPMFINAGSDDDRSWGILRLQQEECSKIDANVDIAVICDCGEYDNIHPVEKRTPGQRLAYQVLYNTYKHVNGKNNIKAVGADFIEEKCTINIEGSNRLYCRPSDGKAFTANCGNEILLGENVHEATDCSDMVYGFEVKGQEGNYYIPKVMVQGNKLILRGRENDKLTEACYGFFNYGLANIYGENELPLMPFRFVLNV